MIIHFKVSGRSNFTLDVESKLTISEVKKLAAEQANVGALQQRIFHKGKLLQDSDTLESVESGSTLILVRGAEKKDADNDDMEEVDVSEESSASPVQCKGGCGFFGNPKTDNLCSKCFGIKLKKDEDDLRKKTERIKEQKKVDDTPKDAASAPASEIESEAKEEPAPPVERPVQENKSRCWVCNKKIGLAGFDCRCGYIFCSSHRYAEQHDCDFDFKTSGRDLLRKQNLTVVADKLDKA